MYLIVLAMGILIVSVGLSTVIMPEVFKSILSNFLKKKWLWPASIFRFLLGIGFLMAANETSMPLFVNTVACVLIAAGISLPVIGQSRLNQVAFYWFEKKDWLWRIAGFLAMLFGISLAMAGMPV
jgi:hypothetical protein